MINLTTSYNASERIWQGGRQNSDFENESVGELCFRMMSNKSSNDVCQISDSEGSKLTFHEALSNAKQLAKHMRQWQLTCDDIVGIVATNTTYLMQIVLAAWFNGVAFHAISPDQEEESIYYLFNKTKPKVIFCDGLHLDKIISVTQSLYPIICTICNHTDNMDVIKIEDLLTETTNEEEYSFSIEPCGNNQTMAILCTSATIGLPKCVKISNKMCILNLGLFNNDSATVFSFAHIDWIFGFQALLSNILYGNLRIITTNPYTPEYLSDIISRYQVNCLYTTPIQMSQLSLMSSCCKETMESLKFILISGSWCLKSYLTRLHYKLPQTRVINIYGTTECGGISANYCSENKPKSVGKLLPNIELKIINDGTGERLGPYEIGKIYVRDTTNNWLGYYHDIEASYKILDGDNFLETGDLGFMDEENYLYLSDRCESILQFQQKYYSPYELEVIIAELDEVQDVCVVGIEHDNEEGDEPAAAIVRADHSNLTAQDIREHVERRRNVEDNSLVYGVFFVKEIPRNCNGKVLKKKVVEICKNMKNKGRVPVQHDV